MNVKRKLGTSGFLAPLQIATIVVIIILIIGIGMVAAARGNPFAKKTYVKTSVKVAGGDYFGIVDNAEIINTDTQEREQSWFESQWIYDVKSLAGWDPVSKEVNIEMILYEEVDGTMTEVDSYRDSKDLTALNQYSHTFESDLGPLQDDATGYEIELILTAEDGSDEDSKTITGSL